MTQHAAQEQLYTAAFAEDSLDAYLARHGRVGRWLYLVLLAMLVVSAAMLPIIRVQPSVRSAGVVRPTVEKQDVRARASGIVSSVRLRENANVRQGDTLALLRAEAWGERRGLTASRLAERRRLVHDLELLTRGPMPAGALEGTLFASSLRREYASFQALTMEFELRQKQAERELARAKQLAEQGFVTQSEIDERTFALSRIMSEWSIASVRVVAEWETRLAEYRTELTALETEQRQLAEQGAQYAIVAPITGTVEQIASLSPGSYLAEADRIAVISPTSRLLADVDVRPRDVGLLRPGMPVRLRIDAFDASDWGFVTGSIFEISNDAVPVSGGPVFRVRVSLDQETLSLRTGITGQLKKGMTLQARFLLNERTLWQLLFDDVSDWLDPTRDRR
jgi:HlyD family secretion protein